MTYLLFISHICCVAGHSVSKFIHTHVCVSCPQKVKQHVDAGMDVNAQDAVSLVMVGTIVGVGMQVG